jgi:hypothetical protein
VEFAARAPERVADAICDTQAEVLESRSLGCSPVIPGASGHITDLLREWRAGVKVELAVSMRATARRGAGALPAAKERRGDHRHQGCRSSATPRRAPSCSAALANQLSYDIRLTWPPGILGWIYGATILITPTGLLIAATWLALRLQRRRRD